jgi:hypothetical protein
MPENTNKEEKTGFGSKNLRTEPNKIFTMNHIREDKKDFASKNLHREPQENIAKNPPQHEKKREKQYTHPCIKQNIACT